MTRATILAVALWVIGSCDADSVIEGPPTGGIERLTTRPPRQPVESSSPGIYPLGIAVTKDARLIIPSIPVANTPIPILVMLHGAGGDEAPMEPIIAAAAEHGVALLLPRSRDNTWDVALGGFGADIQLIDEALEEAFRRVRVDPARIGIGGFSDGASYALSIGLANGDLFTHVLAFAPGFMTPVPRIGKSEFFILHGSGDVVTSARTTEENFIPFLRALGYSVRYHEFTGGHQVRATEADLGLRWLAGTADGAQ